MWSGISSLIVAAPKNGRQTFQFLKHLLIIVYFLPVESVFMTDFMFSLGKLS